jgi:hypothetical protein
MVPRTSRRLDGNAGTDASAGWVWRQRPGRRNRVRHEVPGRLGKAESRLGGPALGRGTHWLEGLISTLR